MGQTLSVWHKVEGGDHKMLSWNLIHLPPLPLPIVTRYDDILEGCVHQVTQLMPWAYLLYPYFYQLLCTSSTLASKISLHCLMNVCSWHNSVWTSLRSRDMSLIFPSSYWTVVWSSFSVPRWCVFFM